MGEKKQLTYKTIQKSTLKQQLQAEGKVEREQSEDQQTDRQSERGCVSLVEGDTIRIFSKCIVFDCLSIVSLLNL